MTVFFIILIWFLITLLAILFSNFVGVRTVGIKASSTNIVKLTAILLMLQVLGTLTAYLLGDSLVSILVSLTLLIGSFIIWHKFLNYYYHARVGRSIVSYLIAGAIGAVLTLIIAIVATSFVQSFKISGNIMNPTLKNGDIVIAYKRDQELTENKVVIYNYSDNEQSRKTVGRIVYVPGQTATINEKYQNADGTLSEPGEYTLEDDEYYIVGDNKENTIPRIIKASEIIGVVGPTIKKAN